MRRNRPAFPMSYLALRFDTAAAAADVWADALQDAGALSVDIADAFAETADESPVYDEPDVASVAGWPVNRWTPLFSAATGLAAALVPLAASGETLPPHETFTVPEQDWVRLPRRSSRRSASRRGCGSCRHGASPTDPAAINLALDPGLAFGTGSHPTTRLCLRWLARESRAGESVLDYGCGSGILAIAASRLGAGRVVGIDIDPQALAAAAPTRCATASRRPSFRPTELAAAERTPFDIVVANILANPLICSRPRSPATCARADASCCRESSTCRPTRSWLRTRGGLISTSAKGDDGWVALGGTRRDECAT